MTKMHQSWLRLRWPFSTTDETPFANDSYVSPGNARIRSE